jgi:transposase
MPPYVGLDASQKETTICVVDEQGRRLWRGTAPTDPEALTQILQRHGCDLLVGVETGPLMPWLVHGLRRHGPEDLSGCPSRQGGSGHAAQQE